MISRTLLDGRDSEAAARTIWTLGCEHGRHPAGTLDRGDETRLRARTGLSPSDTSCSPKAGTSSAPDETHAWDDEQARHSVEYRHSRSPPNAKAQLLIALTSGDGHGRTRRTPQSASQPSCSKNQVSAGSRHDTSQQNLCLQADSDAVYRQGSTPVVPAFVTHSFPVCFGYVPGEALQLFLGLGGA